MTQPDLATTKENVRRFDDDVRTTGSYEYTTGRLSSRLANARISSAISAGYSFEGKRVLDLGCGDGTYSVEFPSLGANSVLGVDPAAAAIESATARAAALGLSDRVRFATGDIYRLDALLESGTFDVIVLRGVLHHLPDPRRAVLALGAFRGAIVVLEPNGLNPVLKVLEKVSHYHVEHEERSFLPGTIRNWLEEAGFMVERQSLINLVPMFSPDWMAAPLHRLGPLVERVPGLRAIACGQCLIVAQR